MDNSEDRDWSLLVRADNQCTITTYPCCRHALQYFVCGTLDSTTGQAIWADFDVSMLWEPSKPAGLLPSPQESCGTSTEGEPSRELLSSPRETAADAWDMFFALFDRPSAETFLSTSRSSSLDSTEIPLGTSSPSVGRVLTMAFLTIGTHLFIMVLGRGQYALSRHFSDLRNLTCDFESALISAYEARGVFTIQRSCNGKDVKRCVIQ